MEKEIDLLLEGVLKNIFNKNNKKTKSKEEVIKEIEEKYTILNDNEKKKLLLFYKNIVIKASNILKKAGFKLEKLDFTVKEDTSNPYYIKYTSSIDIIDPDNDTNRDLLDEWEYDDWEQYDKLIVNEFKKIGINAKEYDNCKFSETLIKSYKGLDNCFIGFNDDWSFDTLLTIIQLKEEE